MPIIHRDTDYAVRALAHLAQTDGVVAVSALAESVNVPQDFLRKIMQRLQRARLVRSAQGPLGGYALRKAAEGVTLLDVVTAVQGPVALNACLEDRGICRSVKVCALRHKLVSVQKDLNSWLEGITLADVAGAVYRRTGT